MYSKKTRIYLATFLIIGWGVTLFLAARPAKKLYHDNRILMGTFWEVSSPNKEAAAIVFEEISRMEGLLSKYRNTSEISRLNRNGRLKATPEIFQIIKKAKEFSVKTEGAFDITVGPLVDIWGFSERIFKIPRPEEIQNVLELVGSDKIILHEKTNLIELKEKGVKIDLGGIGKGLALDSAVKKLKAKGIKSCLINAGGQVYALGDRFGEFWHIGIKNPQGNKINRFLLLINQSVSTSGNYEQFFLKDGKRYSHIIDPRTGYPAGSNLNSVTVISKSAAEADALSTALFVLGKEKENEILKNFPEAKVKY